MTTSALSVPGGDVGGGEVVEVVDTVDVVLTVVRVVHDVVVTADVAVVVGAVVDVVVVLSETVLVELSPATRGLQLPRTNEVHRINVLTLAPLN